MINGDSGMISELEFRKLSLPSNALLTTAMRHEATLYRINVEPLRQCQAIDEQYLYWFKHLFLLTFFYDYCLDQSGEEQFPEAFFISTNMWNEYRQFVSECYGDNGLRCLDDYNAQQVYYQIIERQWLNPSEYHDNFPDYSEYYKKQVLCLSHLELLKFEGSTSDIASLIFEFYKSYWTLVLLIDDIEDVERDIESRTLTPMIGWFYAKKGRMPTAADASELRRFGKDEFNRLFPRFEKEMFELDLLGYLDLISDMRDSLKF